MTATPDEVWAEGVLQVYGTSLYPAALRMTRNAPDAEDSRRRRSSNPAGQSRERDSRHAQSARS